MRGGTKFRCSFVFIIAIFIAISSAQAPCNSSIQYSPLNFSGEYVSNANFNPKSMGGHYDMSVNFIYSVVNVPFPEDLIIYQDGNIVIVNDDYQALVNNYAGLIAFTVCLLVLGLTLLFVGMILGCCRCCGNCGGKAAPYEKSNCEFIANIVFAVLLCAAAGLFLYATVCAFSTNEQLYVGTNSVTYDLKDSLQDVNTYFTETLDQVNTLTNKNFMELTKVLVKNINETNFYVDELVVYATNIDTLDVGIEMMMTLKDVTADFVTLNDSLMNLNKLDDDYNTNMQEIIDDTEANCLIECSSVIDELSKLRVKMDFTQLAYISSYELFWTNANVTDILKLLEDARKDANETIVMIDESFKNATDLMVEEITAAEKYIDDVFTEVTQSLEEVMETVNNFTLNTIDLANDYIVQYSGYAYGGILALSIILLVVPTFLLIGLGLGMFSKRPKESGGSFFNKGKGGSCIMISVYITFYVAIIVTILTVGLFAVGMLGQTWVCEPLKDPVNNPGPMKLLDDYLNLEEKTGLNITVQSLLSDCYENKSVYDVLDLQTLINLDIIRNGVKVLGIDLILGNLTLMVDYGEVILLTNYTEVLLRNLTSNNEFTSFDNSEMNEVLDAQFSNTDFTKFLTLLDSAIPKNPGLENVKPKVIAQQELVNETYEIALEMKELGAKINNSLKLGYDSFEDAINQFIIDTDAVQTYVNTVLKENITHYTEVFGNTTECDIDNYFQKLANDIEKNVGVCAPLAGSINNTVITTCDKVLTPVNGFWFALFWCSMLFVAIILFGTILDSYFKQYEEENAAYNSGSFYGGPAATKPEAQPYQAYSNPWESSDYEDVSQNTQHDNVMDKYQVYPPPPSTMKNRNDDLDKYQVYPPPKVSSKNKDENENVYEELSKYDVYPPVNANGTKKSQEAPNDGLDKYQVYPPPKSSKSSTQQEQEYVELNKYDVYPSTSSKQQPPPYKPHDELDKYQAYPPPQNQRGSQPYGFESYGKKPIVASQSSAYYDSSSSTQDQSSSQQSEYKTRF